MTDHETRIVRAPRREHFTIIPNAILQRSDLTRRAKGLLCELLSRPDGWTTSAQRLADTGPEGRDAMRTALRELEQVGYVIRDRWRDPDTQQWRSRMTVHDEPVGLRPGRVSSTGSDQGEYPSIPRSEPVRVSRDGFPATGSPALLERTKQRTEEGGRPRPAPAPNLEPTGRCAAHADGDPGTPCRACGIARREREEWLAGAPARRAEAERDATRRFLEEQRSRQASPRSAEWTKQIKADLARRSANATPAGRGTV